MSHARIALMLVLGCFLMACSESEHTIDWYKEHKAERDEKITWCKNDTARMLTVDCMNADKAHNLSRLAPKAPRAIDTLNLDVSEERKAMGLDKDKAATEKK